MTRQFRPTTRNMHNFAAIADWFLANPAGKQIDCALFLGLSPMTISFVVNSDMYKEYFAQRRREVEEGLKEKLQNRMGALAETGLELIAEKMKQKRTEIPMGQLLQVTGSALDRLGFGVKPQGPQVVVNQNNTDNRQVVVAPVDLATLEIAREAMRRSQSLNAVESAARTALPSSTPKEEAPQTIEGEIINDTLPVPVER